MSDSVGYSLYLSSFTGAPFLTNRSDLGSVKYNIDWDAFFNRDNYRYKSCRIRHYFLSDPSTGSVYTYDPANFNGVLVAQGLNSTNNSPYNGLVLGLIGVQCVPYLSNSVAINNTTVLYSDFLNFSGQNIQVPKGYRDLTIQLWSNNFSGSGASLLSAVSPTNIPLGNWNLNIIFELYDPVDEI